MKKNVLLLFVFVALLSNSTNCFAANVQNAQTLQYENIKMHREILPYSSYTATLHSDNSVSLQQTISTYSYEIVTSGDSNDIAYGGEECIPITLEHMPYCEDGYSIMIPLRESIGRELVYREWIENNYSDISEQNLKELVQNNYSQIAEHDYSNYTEKVHFQRDTQSKSVTLLFTGDKMTFYDGKREFYINGIKMGLYLPPHITDEEVFLCDKDITMLFQGSISYSSKAEKQVLWGFRSVTGYPLSIENQIFIDTVGAAQYPETFRVSTQYDGTIFYPDNHGGKEHERSIDVYEKNNHMMIALQSIPRFRGTVECLETVWYEKTNTATLKIWGEVAKDVTFTKDSNKMIVNGEEIAMEEPAEIKDSRMYIPITALFQILEIPQQNIQWIEQGKNVKITYGQHRNWETI